MRFNLDLALTASPGLPCRVPVGERALSGTVLILAPLALLLAAAAGASGQEPPPARPGIVVRVTVELVQVDAVVTDKQGHQVTDLTPADFVIKEDGREREIAQLSYVRLVPPRTASVAPPAPSPGAKAAPSPGSMPALASRVRGRMITIVVDDLNVSFEGLERVREALHRYIDTGLAPGDRAAILRTGGGVSIMEQYTSDAARLHAAVDGLRYNYLGMAGVGGPGVIDTQVPFRGPSPHQNIEHGMGLEALRRDMVEVGTIGALRRIVKGLAPFPGRKPVIVFSDGFKIEREPHLVSLGLSESYIRALTDEANRASVALYTISTLGLWPDAFQAADNLTYFTRGAPVSKSPGPRGFRERFDAEESLSYLADRTGGLMVKASNDPGRGLDRVLADQEGYYLLGYTPPASFFEKAGGRLRFHKIQVSVRRPGLRVRSRVGFYGVPDAAAAEDSSRGERLAAALVSPFAAADLGLRLQALFVDDEKTGPTLRAMLRIDGRDLTFVEKPGGGWQVVLDVAAVTYGADGTAVDRKDQTFTVSTPAAERPSPDTAFYYTVQLPVTKPGPYQFRVVAQDTASGRLGAASEVVVVPDIERGGLALSGIVVGGATGEAPATEGPDGGQARVGLAKPGGSFDYAFQVLNARLDPATARPQLQTQVRLWHGGKAVYEGPRTPLPLEHAGGERVTAGGRLNLGANLEPGDYGLQVIVTDTLAPAERSVATEWTRLEVVR